MNELRLNDNELLDKKHVPVQMILNEIDEKSFLKILEAISKGNAKPSGHSTKISAKADPTTVRSLQRENEAAEAFILCI
ncbi:hypothetical protein [Butyrivibrio sp. INlla21]|uniref:hypothetical protein n=1 Tax=Butyrivibrio sp. INlla21 TaxID=1520811 RepID=UPI000B8564F3|nr:hypothetical protein [Butyrivibrio sp. INlla21]